MTPELMFTDLMAVVPTILHFVISIIGIALVICGLRDMNKLTHFQHMVEVPIGFISVIVGLVLMYYGGAFPVIWSIIKWVS